MQFAANIIPGAWDATSSSAAISRCSCELLWDWRDQ